VVHVEQSLKLAMHAGRTLTEVSEHLHSTALSSGSEQHMATCPSSVQLHGQLLLVVMHDILIIPFAQQKHDAWLCQQSYEPIAAYCFPTFTRCGHDSWCSGIPETTVIVYGRYMLIVHLALAVLQGGVPYAISGVRHCISDVNCTFLHAHFLMQLLIS
jgi:hypothetical protein